MIYHPSATNPPFYRDSHSKVEDSNFNFDLDPSDDRYNIATSDRQVEDRSLTLEQYDQSEILTRYPPRKLIFDNLPGGVRFNESTIQDVRDNSRLVSHFRTRSLTEDPEIRRSDNLHNILEPSRESSQNLRRSQKSFDNSSIDKKFHQFKIDMEKVLNTLKEEATKDISKALNKPQPRHEPIRSLSVEPQRPKRHEMVDVYRKHTFNYTEEDSKEGEEYRLNSYNSIGKRGDPGIPSLMYTFPKPSDLLQKSLVTIEETDRSCSMISADRDDTRKRTGNKQDTYPSSSARKTHMGQSTNSRNSIKRTEETLPTELTRNKDVVFIEEERRSKPEIDIFNSY